MGENQWSAIVSEAETPRCGGKAWLAQSLREARARSLALFERYEAALGPDLRVPCTPELNLPLWELGHIGWFADWWLARYPQRHLGVNADPNAARSPARQAARGVDADALYNSSEVPHDARWRLALPGAGAVRADLMSSLDDTLALLAEAPEDDPGLYFFRLALFHEDMHGEAAVYMAQTLGFDPCHPQPAAATQAVRPTALHIAAADCTLGRNESGFAFDNELGAHHVAVGAFEIDARPVTWAQFLPFIEGGSYAQRHFWSAPGWIWRIASTDGQERQAPRYLRQTKQGWEQQVFGRWQALDLAAPASHLTSFEAQAWCAWAGRRLPDEAEWAVALQDPAFEWGAVWEWTSSAFAPFPGFKPHPYLDYSRPWFDGRPVLKGASFATAARMRHPQYRNFFTPERNDIVAGFRSVAA